MGGWPKIWNRLGHYATRSLRIEKFYAYWTRLQHRWSVDEAGAVNSMCVMCISLFAYRCE